MNYINNKVIIITGPTASSKSNLALFLAQKLNGSIINADSSQVYKELPILTNSPTVEETKLVNHYLYNFISLNQSFKVTYWLDLVINTINQLIKSNKTPILVGGNAFYINTLINGLTDIPEASTKNINIAQDMLKNIGLEKFRQYIEKFDPTYVKKFTDPYRLIKAYSIYLETGITLSNWQKKPKKQLFQHKYKLIKIIPERINLYHKINTRFKLMIENGAIEEAQSILNSNILPTNYKKVIGLTDLINYLLNHISLEEAIALASQKTRNYAKRQITWCKNKLKNAIVFSEQSFDSILNTLLNK